MIAKQIKDYFKRENIVKDFFARVDRIKNDEIRDFTNEVLESGPDGFWYAVSSTSGRNHPPENNLSTMGLLIHVIKAVDVAEELFRFFGVDDEIDQDIIRSSVLLHDLFKQGNPWTDKHEKEHGLICAKYLEDFELDEYIKRKIQKNIESHMSSWSYPISSLKKFIIPDNLQMIVALADYFSSRNQISFYSGLSILGDKNEQRQES